VASLLGDVLSGVGAEVVLDAWRNGSDGATDPDAVVVLLWSAAWGRTSMEPGRRAPWCPSGWTTHPCRPSSTACVTYGSLRAGAACRTRRRR